MATQKVITIPLRLPPDSVGAHAFVKRVGYDAQGGPDAKLDGHNNCI
jgi:hypothetical protein